MRGVRGLVFAGALLAAGGVGAWGPGHDTTARCILEKMPAEWRARFRPEWMKDYLAAAHLPDSGKSVTKVLRPAEVAWFRQNADLKDDGYVFHDAPCLPGEVNRLVDALRRGDDYQVFIYLAAISHALADPVACNHDPIIHLATYVWRGPAGNGLDVLPRTGRELPVDFAFVESDAETKAVLARRLAALRVPEVPPDLTPAALGAAMLRWNCLALEPCCAESETILENGMRWMVAGDTAAKRAAADALCTLGLWSVARTLYVFEAARRFAASGAPLPDAAQLAALKRDAATNELAVIGRPMAGDSFARPYFPAAGKPCRFAVLYDPTAHMASSVFCAGARALGCQTVGSLRKIRPDLNAGLWDARRFVREGLDPAVTPYVMVFQRIAGYRRFDAKRCRRRLVDFKKAGGTVIWVDGAAPADLFGKAVTAAMTDDGHRDGYCRPAFPVPLDALMQSSFAWVGPSGERVWPYRRRPNGTAGWVWHGSPWHFDAAKLPPGVRPLTELRTPSGTFLTGIQTPGAVYLPMNALFPYCLTLEKPQLVPFRLALDSAGETMLANLLRQP